MWVLGLMQGDHLTTTGNYMLCVIFSFILKEIYGYQRRNENIKKSNLITVGTHDMLGTLEVKGEATDASASDREIPACAVRKAPQSLAPSPHIPTHKLK